MNVTETLLLTIAIAVALYGYIHYGREIHRQTLRPRPFSWLIWGVLGTCVSIIQIENGAGLGTVGTLLGAVAGYVLAAMAWQYGHRKVYGLDIVSLLLALAVFAVWSFIGDQLTVIAATCVYMIGFIPTAVRAYKAPYKERQLPFVMSVIKYTISVLLLGNVVLSTAVYPAALALANFAFLIMLQIRRRASPPLKKKRSHGKRR